MAFELEQDKVKNLQFKHTVEMATCDESAQAKQDKLESQVQAQKGVCAQGNNKVTKHWKKQDLGMKMLHAQGNVYKLRASEASATERKALTKLDSKDAQLVRV